MDVNNPQRPPAFNQGTCQDDPNLHSGAGNKSATVHTPGTGSSFGGNSQPIAETFTPKNVPDP